MSSPDTPRHLAAPILATLIVTVGLGQIAGAAEDELVIEDDIGDGELVIEPDGAENDPMIDQGGDELTIDDPDGETPPLAGDASESAAEPSLQFGLDEARLDFGHLPDGNADSNHAMYGHLSASARWQASPRWTLQLAGRLDAHDEDARGSFTRIHTDYGDSYLRYRGDSTTLTFGSQTVIWGRLDEIPLSDKVSTPDLQRTLLDDIEDRRRSTPMVRAEAFFGGGKLDLVWLYDFRAAELPHRDSVWYPIDIEAGRLLGIDRDDIPPAAVRGALVDEDEPSGDGGVGARYTRTHSFADIGVTLARTRQPTPYFRADGAGRFKAEYPRSWTVGADTAIDAAGITWRAELVYNSDIPVTRVDTGFSTAPGLAWGAGIEMHPGDGDTRINLQLIGNNLIDAPEILDRKEVYSLTGEIDMPFDRERWRASLDFMIGLDEKDVYVNPELTFLGFEPHEFYVAAHLFDGSEQSLGGFYEDNASVNLGWRAKF